jgi:hypothetical protein
MCARPFFFEIPKRSGTDKKANMQATTMTQGVYLNIPRADWTLFQELVDRFGWQAKTSEQVLDEFIKTRPQNVDLSEEDIMNEVRAVRYA